MTRQIKPWDSANHWVEAYQPDSANHWDGGSKVYNLNCQRCNYTDAVVKCLLDCGLGILQVCNSWGATSASRLRWEKPALLCESARKPPSLSNNLDPLSREEWTLTAARLEDIKSNFDSTLCTSQFNIWKQLHQLCQRLPLYIKKKLAYFNIQYMYIGYKLCYVQTLYKLCYILKCNI